MSDTVPLPRETMGNPAFSPVPEVVPSLTPPAAGTPAASGAEVVASGIAEPVPAPLSADFPQDPPRMPPAPAKPRFPQLNAGEVTADDLKKQYSTRLPNITLPGPDDGVRVEMPFQDVLPVEKDFDVARVRIADSFVTVFPKVAGDHELPVSIQTKGGKVFVTTFLLTVNADPKTLWKDNPVPAGTPFAKDNRVAFHSDDGAVRILGASQRGRSHAQQGTCRDDDMAFWSDPATGRYVLAVADGAGSAKFSRQGSKIAVETAIQELSEKLTEAVWASEGGDFSPDGNVCKVLLGAARAAVGDIDAFVKGQAISTDDGKETPALKDFNTTLFLAVVKRFADGALRGATFSIGDGAIAWWQPGTARLLCTPDGGEFSGQTKFLTTLSVWKEGYAALQKTRCFTFQKTAAEARNGFLFLMTDGVSDPFFETDNLLKNPAEWDIFQTEQMASLGLFGEAGEAAAGAAAGRLLGFWSVGNHDDRTIAVLGMAPEPPPQMPPPLPPEEGERPGLLSKLFGRKE